MSDVLTPAPGIRYICYMHRTEHMCPKYSEHEGEWSMLRSAASKVMWVGRATVFLVGLSVILALVFGVASSALGANGGSFILGKAANSATRVTGLIGKVAAGSALVVKNPSGGSALDLSVGDPAADPATKTVAPMKVNSQQVVTNLNADQLDGKDSGQFATRLHALIKGSDGSLVRGNGVTAQFKTASPSAGGYEVLFDRNVTNCVYVATLASESAGRGGDGPAGEIGVRPLSTNPAGVAVSTFNSSGTLANNSFSLTVFC